MDEVEKLVENKLIVIEKIYGLSIEDRRGLAKRIALAAEDTEEAMRVCTAVNTWIATQKKSSKIMVPDGLLAGFIERIKRQKRI